MRIFLCVLSVFLLVRSFLFLTVSYIIDTRFAIYRLKEQSFDAIRQAAARLGPDGNLTCGGGRVFRLHEARRGRVRPHARAFVCAKRNRKCAERQRAGSAGAV